MRSPRRRPGRRWTEVPTVASRGRSGTVPARPAPGPVRLLGLDPGSLQTGFALLDCAGAEVRYVASGTIRARGSDFPARLRQIYEGVLALVEQYAPGEIAIERVFMHRNPDSALKLGQARGAALCAVFGAQAPVFEYAPREVKLAVVGSGAAQKSQVQLMVRTVLGLRGDIGVDAADALGIALCHAHRRAALQFGVVPR